MATTTVNHGAAVRRFMLAVALCLTPLSSALADVRILASPGGAVGNYLNFFSQVRRSGERVIDRRAMYVGLHAGSQHYSPQPDLRHLEGCPRVPCAPDP